MVLGFVVFWPLGFAMLAYILFGERLRDFKRDVNERTDGMFAGCGRYRNRHRHSQATSPSTTGAGQSLSASSRNAAS